MTLAIRDNAGRHRYETEIDGHIAALSLYFGMMKKHPEFNDLLLEPPPVTKDA